ncbi:hypothetical protein NQD34_003902 [Periophthalmus magnuspinnatus]|nr:hypothetical protein NQD34_003902 [Periophthalmus magnuspinnatus]
MRFCMDLKKRTSLTLPTLTTCIEFIDGWNNHPLRTEQNLSPKQLWAMGHIQSPVMDPELPQELDGVDSVHWEDAGISQSIFGKLKMYSATQNQKWYKCLKRGYFNSLWYKLLTHNIFRK